MRTAFLALALTLGCGPNLPAGEEPAPANSPSSFESVALRVSDISGVRELTLRSDGDAAYVVGTNIDRPDQHELGSFAFVTPADMFSEVNEALAELPSDLVDHRPLMLDDHVRRLHIERAGTVELFFGTQEPVPPAAQTLIDRLEAIAVASLTHPRCAIRVALADAHLAADGAFRAELRIAQLGEGEATFGNPARAPSPGSTPYLLLAWREGGEERYTADHVSMSGADTSDTLRLAKGAVATFALSARLPSGLSGALHVRLMLTGGILQNEGASVPLGDVYAPAVTVAAGE